MLYNNIDTGIVYDHCMCYFPFRFKASVSYGCSGSLRFGHTRFCDSDGMV